MPTNPVMVSCVMSTCNDHQRALDPFFIELKNGFPEKQRGEKKSITVISYTSAKLPKSSSFATHFHFLKCHAKYFFHFRTKILLGFSKATKRSGKQLTGAYSRD